MVIFLILKTTVAVNYITVIRQISQEASNRPFFTLFPIIIELRNGNVASLFHQKLSLSIDSLFSVKNQLLPRLPINVYRIVEKSIFVLNEYSVENCRTVCRIVGACRSTIAICRDLSQLDKICRNVEVCRRRQKIIRPSFFAIYRYK